MITFSGSRTGTFCDGLSRRDFLRIGSLGIGGAALPTLSQAAISQQSDATRSVVMIYLPGGPTQFETFDPKPEAPKEIRGSFGPISTKVPGFQICELLPKLAATADKFSVVRTLVGMENRHESFQCYTGRPGGRVGDNEPAGGWPTFGSVVSRVLGPSSKGTVPYVDACPPMGYAPYRNRGIHNPASRVSWPGFTGRAHVPFAIEGNVKSDLILNGVNLQRLNHRRDLLHGLGSLQKQLESKGVDTYQRQALDLLNSRNLADALDVDQEPQSVRDRYGPVQNTHPSFGGAPQNPQLLLLTRRLVEAGVRCVTVSFGAWDWHANREGTIEYLANRYLPVFDHALSVFLQDLSERGLLETTTVVVWGEFGRTPRVNAKGGRDHWPGTQSVLLAGGGIQGGRVLGETDPIGGVPAARPVHVHDVFATLYHNLGINVETTTITDLSGRPRYLIDDGYGPISELL